MVPSPRWPNSPLPQHDTPPDVSRAQLWYEPADTSAAVVMPVTGGWGAATKVPEPLPNRPASFRPVHCTVPSSRRMQPPRSVTSATWSTPANGAQLLLPDGEHTTVRPLVMAQRSSRSTRSATPVARGRVGSKEVGPPWPQHHSVPSTLSAQLNPRGPPGP